MANPFWGNHEAGVLRITFWGGSKPRLQKISNMPGAPLPCMDPHLTQTRATTTGWFQRPDALVPVASAKKGLGSKQVRNIISLVDLKEGISVLSQSLVEHSQHGGSRRSCGKRELVKMTLPNTRDLTTGQKADRFLANSFV